VSPTPTYQEPQSKSSGLLAALVAGALIALIAANIYLYVQIDHLRTDVAKVRESLSTELSNLRDASSVTTASQARHLETMKADLETARAQARDQALMQTIVRPTVGPKVAGLVGKGGAQRIVAAAPILLVAPERLLVAVIDRGDAAREQQDDQREAVLEHREVIYIFHF